MACAVRSYTLRDLPPKLLQRKAFHTATSFATHGNHAIPNLIVHVFEKEHAEWKPFSKRQSLGFLGIFHARIDAVLIVITNFKLDILTMHYFFTPEHFSFFESDDLFLSTNFI